MNSQAKGRTFLLCHGAWGGGWSWKKMHPLMRAAGHRLLTPTYTGLGERADQQQRVGGRMHDSTLRRYASSVSRHFRNGSIGAGVIYSRRWTGTIAIAPQRQFHGNRR